MKQLIKLAIASLLALLAVACEKPVPILDVSVKEIVIDRRGGNISFTVNANNVWTVISSESWCEIKTRSGDDASGVYTLMARVAPNSEHMERSCIITITSGELSAQVYVIQREMDYDLTSAAQSIVINVSTSAALSATVSEDARSWIAVQETKSLHQESLILSIARNDSYESRSGVVTIRNENGLKEDVKIKQRQSHAILLSQHEYRLSGDEQNIVLNFQSSFEDYEIVVGNEAREWIIPGEGTTKALQEKSEPFLILANPSGDDERIGTIMIRDREEDVYEYVTIIQSASELLNPMVSTLLITGEEQVFTVPLVSTMGFEYNVTSGESWLSKMDTKSATHYDLPFAAKVNMDGTTRQGSIGFQSTVPGKNGDVTIRQLPLGHGVITIESEGTAHPRILFYEQASWQYHWEDGTVSQINEEEWKTPEGEGSHTTKVLIDNPQSVTIITTGVKVLDLRQY